MHSPLIHPESEGDVDFSMSNCDSSSLSGILTAASSTRQERMRQRSLSVVLLRYSLRAKRLDGTCHDSYNLKQETEIINGIQSLYFPDPIMK